MGVKMKSPRSILKSIFKIVNLNNKLRFGTTILSILILLAIFEPSINGFILKGENPTTVGLFKPTLPPSMKHPLGTDLLGRDLLALSLHGLKYSFLIGIIAGCISASIGIVIAFIAGYKGGYFDTALRTSTDPVSYTHLTLPTN